MLSGKMDQNSIEDEFCLISTHLIGQIGAKNGIKRRITRTYHVITRDTSRGTHSIRRLLVNQLLSPTSPITSRLLGDEMVRFGLRRWPKLRIEKCSYLGQYFELRKILSCKNIQDHELYPNLHSNQWFCKHTECPELFWGSADEPVRSLLASAFGLS